MRNELKITLADALERFMSEHNLSQNDIAKGAHVNASYIIQIRKKDFSLKMGDKNVQIADKYFHRIADFIGFETEKQYWEPKNTPQLKEIIGKLTIAKQCAETAVITGQTGCGKTYTTGLFQKKFPMDVFVVKVGSSDNLGDLLDKILQALNMDAVKRSKSAKLRQITFRIKELSENGHEPMLIFDESEYMKQPALCALKELYDVLNNWCALVLLGTEQLTDNIEKLKKRNKPGIPQLYRRIKFRSIALPNIDRRFSLFLEGLEKDLQNWLQKNCENYGELHDVLVPAKREAERTNSPLTIEFVKAALGIQQHSSLA